MMQAMGLSWPELMLMPGDQYRGWQRHLHRNPPRGTHHLLATLCALIAAANGVKDPSAADFAPWLNPKAKDNKTVAWGEGLILEGRANAGTPTE